MPSLKLSPSATKEPIADTAHYLPSLAGSAAAGHAGRGALVTGQPGTCCCACRDVCQVNERRRCRVAGKLPSARGLGWTVMTTRPPRAPGAPGYLDPPAPAFLFDLDGTLIDSVYQHVIAWRAALARLGIDLSVWRIHRRIGMSGGLLASALLRETGGSLSARDIAAVQEAHQAEYLKRADSARAVRWAIATSGNAATARLALPMLGLDPQDDSIPLVTREMVAHAKPDPDLFLAAAALLEAEPRHAFVVGDSVWDLLAARRAGAIGVGLLSGGYGREELERAGAYRVYADPADLLARADELGLRNLALPGPG